MKNYYCNPLNIEYKYQFVKNKYPGMSDEGTMIYREAADPSLILFRDKYWLFSSVSGGFLSSENLLDWEYHSFPEDMPIYDYAPDVRVKGEYLYFCASKTGEPCSFYRTKDPISGEFEEIPGTFAFWDPNLFVDEDGKIYFYWGCSNSKPIYGVELDEKTMKPKTEPLIMIHSEKEKNGYERIGKDHVCPKTQEEIEMQAQGLVQQLKQASSEMLAGLGITDGDEIEAVARALVGDAPFIEGAWMTKHNGTYYLQYAIPGTEYNVYGDGVYVSDSPLGPFMPAKNNPFSYKPGGFMNGAGHGSTLQDKEGRFWHTSTMGINMNYSMERRIGLWKAGFDSDGELYCDQRYGDWPVRIDAKPFEKPDMMLLSYGKKVEVSSGRGAECVTDENCKTWWKAENDSTDQWVKLDLGNIKNVQAVQINFMDEDIQTDEPEDSEFHIGNDLRYIDRRPHRTRWILEGSINGKEYYMLENKSEVNTDLAHDFICFPDRICARYLKLTILELPYGEKAAISGIRVFGTQEGELPEQTKEVVITNDGDLDMVVSWQQDKAVGHNILWGYALDKLYHNYMVYGKNKQHIGALIKGQEVYVRVDAFNETGIREGKIVKR